MSLRRGASKRASSGSSHSRSSNESKPRFWLPSLSSKSSTSTDRRARRAAIPHPSDMPLPVTIRTAANIASEALGMPAFNDVWGVSSPLAASRGRSEPPTASVTYSPTLDWPGAPHPMPHAPAGGYPHATTVAALHPGRQPVSSAAEAAMPAGGSRDSGQHLRQDGGAPAAEGEALQRQNLLAQIPRNQKGKLTSLGSIRHKTGNCSPCLFWFRQCCTKGVNCDYCHIRHKGQKNKRIRPSKKTRMQMRAQSSDDEGDGAGDGLGTPGPSGPTGPGSDAFLQTMNTASPNSSDDDSDNEEDLLADSQMPDFDGGPAGGAPPSWMPDGAPHPTTMRL